MGLYVYSLALFDHEDPIHRRQLHLLYRTIRPVNLYPINLRRITQTEMYTRIVRR